MELISRGCCKYKNVNRFNKNWPNSKQFPKIIKSKNITLDEEINLKISKNGQGITRGRVVLQISFLSKAPTPVSHQRGDVTYRPLPALYIHAYSSPYYGD